MMNGVLTENLCKKLSLKLKEFMTLPIITFKSIFINSN